MRLRADLNEDKRHGVRKTRVTRAVTQVWLCAALAAAVDALSPAGA
jgi:hypothetical protein